MLARKIASFYRQIKNSGAGGDENLKNIWHDLNVIIEDGRPSGAVTKPPAERDNYVGEWVHGLSFRKTLHEFPRANW